MAEYKSPSSCVLYPGSYQLDRLGEPRTVKKQMQAGDSTFSARRGNKPCPWRIVLFGSGKRFCEQFAGSCVQASDTEAKHSPTSKKGCQVLISSKHRRNDLNARPAKFAGKVAVYSCGYLTDAKIPESLIPALPQGDRKTCQSDGERYLLARTLRIRPALHCQAVPVHKAKAHQSFGSGSNRNSSNLTSG